MKIHIFETHLANKYNKFKDQKDFVVNVIPIYSKIIKFKWVDLKYAPILIYKIHHL